LFEKARDMLEEETDISTFFAKFRRLQKIVELKIKLTGEESQYVRNNCFTKIELSETDSSDASGEKITPEELKKREEHEKSASAIFKKKTRFDPYAKRSQRSARSHRARSASRFSNYDFTDINESSEGAPSFIRGTPNKTNATQQSLWVKRNRKDNFAKSMRTMNFSPGI